MKKLELIFKVTFSLQLPSSVLKFPVPLRNSELKTTHNTFRDSRVYFFPTTFLKIAVYTKENGPFRTEEAGILRLFRYCGLKSKPKARKDGFSLLPENNWKRWITSDDASIHQHILTFRGNENSLR